MKKIAYFILMSKSGRGFTLIELLVVIAIVGILMAVVIIGINPVDKIKAAKDSKVMSDVAAVGSALESYATLNSGNYPKTSGELVTSGDLKIFPTAGTTGSTYTYTSLPANCVTAGPVFCTTVCFSGTLSQAKYSTLPNWKYVSSSSAGGTALATANPLTCP